MNIDITPIEIRDYALSLGWTLVREALVDNLFVLNSPFNDYRQLRFPIESPQTQTNDLIEISIQKLAEIYDKSEFHILEAIREVNDDVISLRYYSDSKSVNSLSFNEALESIEAAKQMILAAGSSVVSPALYHKRLARTEAVELLKQTRFRHTEEGSFILKLSCPVRLEVPASSDLFVDEDSQKPVSRKAFELIKSASEKIIMAIEEDSVDRLFAEQKESQDPIISYNFCNSLFSMFDDERELPFELQFRWSRAFLNKLRTPEAYSAIKFPFSFKPKLEELSSYFTPELEAMSDTFVGSVESLNGNEGPDGRRSGEVVLALFIDSEVVRARVNLTADDYDIAWHAHGRSGALIKVMGRLQPGRRIRQLINVKAFEHLEK
jgi:hypothetical protein